MSTHFVIAEDNEFFRKTVINMLISLNGDYELAGEAKDGQEAVDLVERYTPDLLILDLQMPKLDGFAVMRQIRGKHPDLKILILTMNHSKKTAAKALEYGADGYCIKTCGRDELLEALKFVMAGNTHISNTHLE